ncbi:hypothetical protein AVEN_242471-1, partial [Araneus ventricosus]
MIVVVSSFLGGCAFCSKRSSTITLGRVGLPPYANYHRVCPLYFPLITQ